MNLLSVQHLTKAFGGLRAVDDLHFSVKKGSITGLIGPNGAGKTTAFNLITRFLPKDNGVILYAGKKLPMRPHKLVQEKKIARTFQKIRLFPDLTVEENLLLALSVKHDAWWKSFACCDEKEATKEAEKLLRSVDLWKLRNEKACNLSYGQSKLLEILRTLSTEAECILLDEPAAGINPTMLHRVETLIQEMREQGRTFLIIEHNMPFLMDIADEIIVMENGRFLLQDIPSKVQSHPKVLEAYLGT